jgi:hypothetical protein
MRCLIMNPTLVETLISRKLIQTTSRILKELTTSLAAPAPSAGYGFGVRLTAAPEATP